MDQVFRIIVYILAANIAYLIFSLIRQGFKHYSNYIAELFTLMMGSLWLLNQDINPGWVLLLSVIGIIVFIVLPVILQGKIDSLMAENRYDEIKSFATLKSAIAWSSPNSHLKDMADIAYNYAESPVKMVEELKKLLGQGEPYDSMTRLFLGMIHFNRRNFNELINDLRIPDKKFEEQSFEELLYLVRAYLETTRYDEAVEAQIALEKKANENCDNKVERRNNTIINRFVFYAFMGWKDEYNDFLSSNEKGVDLLPQDLRDFWKGVSYFYSGLYDEGEKQMKEVIASIHEDDFVVREFMQKRLYDMLEHKVFFDKHVLPKLKELHEKYNKEITDLVKDNDKSIVEVKPKKFVTEILSFAILVISVIFIVVFNVEDSVELINMGAASSVLVKYGEYFRLVSYIFVHMGFLHLFMNLIALRYFGPPVESIAGWGAFLFIFLISGIGGGALSCYFGTKLTIGASGGVLGLLTAGIVFELFKTKDSPSFSNQSNIFNLVFILIINVVYGVWEKGIDNYAHLGGIIAGALAGLLFVFFINKRALRILANSIALVICVGILGYASYWHISSFIANDFYPSKVSGYKECNIASTTFKVEAPLEWSLDKDNNSPNGISFNGPFNEKIIVNISFNVQSKEEYLKQLIDRSNKEIEELSGFELNSVSGPTKVSFRDNTYKIVWKIKISGRDVSIVDFVVFDSFFNENVWVYKVEYALISKHINRYDSIMEHMVSSLKL